MRCLLLLAGVYLSLNGDIIDNHNEIFTDTIREGDEEALLCFTDLYQFFPDYDDSYVVGQWHYPSGSAVDNDMSADIHTSRDRGVVRLHRKKEATMPIGLYHCKTLDSDFKNQSIYVNITQQESELPSPQQESAVVAGAVICVLLVVMVGFTVVAVLAIRR